LGREGTRKRVLREREVYGKGRRKREDWWKVRRMVVEWKKGMEVARNRLTWGKSWFSDGACSTSIRTSDRRRVQQESRDCVCDSA
ncbi:hypothetical protein CLOP_g12410, partial [Closterium sp. NIES-67]